MEFSIFYNIFLYININNSSGIYIDPCPSTVTPNSPNSSIDYSKYRETMKIGPSISKRTGGEHKSTDAMLMTIN